MPVAAQVIRHAAARPGRVAVSGPHGEITYGDLARHIYATASALSSGPPDRRTSPPAADPSPVRRAATSTDQTRAPGGQAGRLGGQAGGLGGEGRDPGGQVGGLGGQVVGICLADPVQQLIAVLAIDLLGGTPLLMEPTLRDTFPATLHLTTLPTPHPAETARPLTSTPTTADLYPSGTGRAVTSSPATPDPHPSGTSRLPTSTATTAGPRHSETGGPSAFVKRRLTGMSVPSPADLAWACFTSGSTGRPRAVVRTRESWTGSFGPLSEITGIGAEDVVLVPGPLVSSLYGFAAVHALAVGATVLAPGRWAPGALPGLLRTATAVHLVPHLLPRLLDALPENGPLRVAVVGGAALPDGVRERAEGRGVRVVAYYGATELSFVAVDADGGGLRPFPGVEIEVRPPEGEVWVRSPWLAEGYLAGAAGPLKTEDKWMSVGDLADPYTPGEPLRLRGRGDGAIQTGGATVVPEDVESVLRRAPGVGDVVVVATPHPTLGAVVTAVIEADGPPPSRSSLEAVARAGLAAAQRPRRWYATTDLPRTPTGKPARAQVAARLAAPDPELRRLP